MTDKFRMGNFEHERGERSVQGRLNVFAVPPQVGNVPVGPAPPDNRQVQSVYDSRPIGGYDFCLTGTFDTYSAPPLVEARAPLGYVAMVRRIEIEASPAVIAGADMRWVFSSAGVQIPAWTWDMGPTLSERGIDVFFPVASNALMALRETQGGLEFPLFSTVTTIIVRFIGNLLLDQTIPVTQQAGSLPTSVVVVSTNEQKS